jgi:hypothetical protein
MALAVASMPDSLAVGLDTGILVMMATTIP